MGKRYRSGGGSGSPGSSSSSSGSTSSGLGNSDVVQFSRQGDANVVDAPRTARAGTSGGGSSLPVLDQIAPLFGGLDFSGISAHVGGDAAEACDALGGGTKAYSVGADLAFKEAPDPWLAAHEATHYFQKMAGVSVPGNTGSVGDPYEKQADAVADRIVQGQSAADLLPDVSSFSGGMSGADAVQCYKEKEDDNGNMVRISDDGAMAVEQYTSEWDDGSTQENGTHSFWALPELMSGFNKRLKGVGSVAELETLSDEESSYHDAFGDKRKQVSATNHATGTSGDDLSIWADCGRSARDVMGAGKGEGGMKGGAMTAVYNKARKAGFFEKMGNLFKTGSWDSDLEIMEEKETKAYNPTAMKQEILTDLLGGTYKEAIAKYEGMSPKERQAFEQKAGINRYAAPEVGEGYTMASHGDAYKAVTDRDKAFDARNNKTGAMGPDGLVDEWNFHWAAVVAKSGGDTVSLENYATGVPEEKNGDWEHQMYGSKPGQTFWDQHKDTKQHGDDPFAFRVRRRDW